MVTNSCTAAALFCKAMRSSAVKVISITCSRPRAPSFRITVLHLAFSWSFAASGRTPFVLGDPDRELRRVAWCTGAAQSYFDAAIDAGADVYLTGEVSEPTTHTAAESGVAFVAAGHHATERYGVQALGAHLSEKFDIEHLFIDIDNPV